MRSLFLLICVLALFSTNASAQNDEIVLAHQAIDHVGEYAMVCGVIADANFKSDTRGEPTYLNFDKPYPKHDFTAIVWGKHRRYFGDELEGLEGLKACVYGEVDRFKGKAQIVLTRPEQLSVAKPRPVEEVTPE